MTEETIEVLATKSYSYDGRNIVAGQRFHINKRNLSLFRKLGRVRDIAAAPSAGELKATKGKYQRRDMRAED